MLLQKFLNENRYYQLLTWFLCLFAITLPFVKIIYNFIALGCIVFLILISKDSFSNIKQNLKDYFLTSSYFFLILISTAYSSNVEIGINHISKSVVILVMPFCVFSMAKISQLTLFRVLSNFIASLSVFAFLGMLFALAVYLLDFGNYFYYYGYSEILNIHSSYYGMYISFSLSVLLYYFLYINSDQNALFFCGIASFIILIVALYMLAARGATLSFVMVSFILIAIKLKRKIPSIMIYSIIITVIFLASTIAILRLPNFQSRYQNILETEMVWKGLATNNEILNRKVHYQSVIEAWEMNPIFGNGIGDSNMIIQQKYSKNNFVGYEKGYNAHNQFLETLSESGIFGLSILILVFAYCIYTGIKYQNLIMLIFIFILGFAFLTESILHRIHGISFYAFFIPLMIHFSKTSNSRLWV